jgi:hypothetical protein
MEREIAAFAGAAYDDDLMAIRPDWDDPHFVAEFMLEMRRECIKENGAEAPSPAQLLPGLVVVKKLLYRSIRQRIGSAGADRLRQKAVLSHAPIG